jgi:predicted metal-binding protein
MNEELAGPAGRWEVATLEGRGPGREVFRYQRYEAGLPVAHFVCSEEVLAACAACPRYSRNLACPPHSPAFGDAVEGVGNARVICVRLPLGPVGGIPAEERYRKGFHAARSLLVEELLAERARGRRVLGSGPCRACDPCAAEENDTVCRNPAERIFSLESTGVNVVALLRTCFDLGLEWTAEGHAPDFVCSVGAVFDFGD